MTSQNLRARRDPFIRDGEREKVTELRIDFDLGVVTFSGRARPRSIIRRAIFGFLLAGVWVRLAQGTKRARKGRIIPGFYVLTGI